MESASGRKLAQELVELRKAAKDLAGSPQLGNSSFEAGVGKSIDELDPVTGNPVASFGTQYDGTHGAVPYTGPNPPMATQPTLEGDWVRIKAQWDGFFVNEAGERDEMVVAPLGFSRVEVHASQDPNFTGLESTSLRGTIESPRGGEVNFFAPAGIWYVRMVTRTTAGKRSDPTPAVQVESTGLVVNQEFQEAVVSRMAIYLSNTTGAGYTSTITGQGLRVTFTVTDPETNEVLEVQDIIKLGTFDEELLAIHKNGQSVITMNAEGDISAKSGTFEELTYKGEPITEYIAGNVASSPVAGTVVGWASRSSSSPYWAALGKYPYLHLNCDVVPGRQYIIQTTPIGLDGDTTSAEPLLSLHFADGPGAATVSSPIIAQGQAAMSASTASRRSSVTFNRFVTPNVSNVSILLSYSALSGRAKISASTLRSVVMTLIDAGPFVPETGEDRNGSADASTGSTADNDPTPTPIRKNYDETFYYTGVRSYLGNGNHYNYDSGRGYQGLQPYTSNGALKSIWTFPSLTSKLAGATITDMLAYFYFQHWYYAGGGTANIRMHGNSSLPATYNGTSNGMGSSSWPRNAGRWVRIPSSLWSGWISGSFKGLALIGSNYTEYGIASDCRLRIKYTK